ncbi:MAG: protein phosphatase 2C domain-containing protein [Hyphomicrobiaceae bacterium]|nr:protein phosphatase 2C domain-containing protein [Hyphomicrobiaceae bacterium]
MTLLLASAARATVGGRSGQEDAFRLWPGEGVVPPKAGSGGLLAVLADGMGGHTGGAIAGQTACRTFAEVFANSNSPPEARLKAALQASNEALAKGVEQNAALKGMGCTLVAAWIDEMGLRWTSVGDSLLLLYRLPDVIRLNADHSLGSFLDEQARQNKITRSEARRNRNRNALRSALTGSKIDLIDLRAEPLELRPGDWVLLASDGICSLPGDEIADVAYRLRQSTPEEMAEALIAAVMQKAIVDQDNATVVAVRIDGAPEASRGVTTPMLAKAGEEVDLRTRRIGVSRRGPGRRDGGKTRAVAVWLAAAAALVFCAVALLLAVPSLRPTLPSNPAVPGGPPSAPATGGGDRPPAALVPAQPLPGKSTSEPPPSESFPPALSPDRPGDGQEGKGEPPFPAKSAASPPASPPASQPPASEGEGRAPSRPAAAKPVAPGAPSPLLRSAAPPAEGEKPPRASVVRPAAPLPPGARANPSVKPAPGTPADGPGRSTSAGEPAPPRSSKEPNRPKPEVAPGPLQGTPKEDLPRTDPLSNTQQ